MPAPQVESNQQIIWKNDEVKAFSLALIRHAIESLNPHFTTDIVPDSERGAGPGIPGTVTTMLKHAGIIEPIGVWQNRIWFAHRIISERPDAKGRFLNVYKLTSIQLAREFLRRYGSESLPLHPLIQSSLL
jgi:hypothetical protein